MNGYHNLPEATARAMTEDGFYITGDVFRRDADGFYYFVGRADDMFVSGGENIYPGEVEKMLERHPDIHQAVVVPVDDELKYQKPVAFVVPRPGAAPSEEAVKEFALANAAPYLHPRRVWFLPRCRSPAPTRSTAARWHSAPPSCCPMNKLLSDETAGVTA